MNRDDNCIFCKIVSGDIPCYKLYEDDRVLSFLDAFPISKGHALVIPKHHCSQLHECPAEDMEAVSRIVGDVARAVGDSVGAAGYNLLCNTGEAAGQKVFHVHFHIIPREVGDGILKGWPSKEIDKDLAKELSGQIKEKI